MTSIRLLSSILKGKWLLDPHFILSQGPVIARIVNKESEFQVKNETEPDPMNGFAVLGTQPNSTKYSWYRGFDMAPPNSVAVVRMRGTLMKEDQMCGSIGTESIGQIIKAADDHHNIDAIVLHIDSPGGTVDGTEALGNIVKNTAKPIISFVDGLMASAALWIGSNADEIMASTDLDEVGSVGVLASFADVQPYYESLGVKFHTITASTSPDKVKMWEDVRAGKYDSYIKEVLDPIDEKFMRVIRENRPNVNDKHLTGNVFMARDVMGVFVDSIGTIENAISRAYALAHPDDEESDNSNNSNTKQMKQFTKLNGVLGVDSLESQDEHVSLNENQLELVETALADNEQAVADARREAESARDTAVSERTTAIEERDTARSELQTAQTNLTNALDAFNALDETVAAAETPEAKAEAVRTLLAAKPGAAAAGNLDNKDPNLEAAVFDGFTTEEKELTENI